MVKPVDAHTNVSTPAGDNPGPTEAGSRGKPGRSTARVGLGQLADRQIGLVAPANDTASVHQEYLARNGSGVHHHVRYRHDMDDAIERLGSAGFEAVQIGKSLDDGDSCHLPGPIGPSYIEFIDLAANGGTAAETFARVAAAAHAWDGRDPLRQPRFRVSRAMTATPPPEGAATPEGAMPDSYEQARTELAAIVRALEGGTQTLEESLALWERGEALATLCDRWLQAARDRLAAAQEPAGAGELADDVVGRGSDRDADAEDHDSSQM